MTSMYDFHIYRVFTVIDTSKKSTAVASRNRMQNLPYFESLREAKRSLSLEIRGVVFAYATRSSEPVLKGVSMSIHPGCITAICGR